MDFDDLATVPGAGGDVARDIQENPSMPGESPEQTLSRQYTQQAQQERRGRLQADDFTARDIPSYKDDSGNVQPVRDETGAALTSFDPRHGIAYDSSGSPQKLTYGETGPPKLTDPYGGLAPVTDPDTGDKYIAPPGLAPRWVGQDPDIAAQALQAKTDKQLQQAAQSQGAMATVEDAQLKLAQNALNQQQKSLQGRVPSLAMLGPDASREDALKAINDHFDSAYDDPRAQEKSGGFLGLGGDLSDNAQAYRQSLDQGRASTLQQAAKLYDQKDQLDQARDTITGQRNQQLAMLAARANDLSGAVQGKIYGVDPASNEVVLNPTRPADSIAQAEGDKVTTFTDQQKQDANQVQTQLTALQAAKAGQKPYTIQQRPDGKEGVLTDPAKPYTSMMAAVSDGLLTKPPADIAREAKIMEDAIDKSGGAASYAEAIARGGVTGGAAAGGWWLGTKVLGGIIGVGLGALVPGGGETGITEAAGAAYFSKLAVNLLAGFIGSKITAKAADTALQAAGRVNDWVASVNDTQQTHNTISSVSDFLGNAIGSGGIGSLKSLGELAIIGKGFNTLSGDAAKAVMSRVGTGMAVGAGFEQVLRQPMDRGWNALTGMFGIAPEKVENPTFKSTAISSLLAGILGGYDLQFQDLSQTDITSAFMRAAVREKNSIKPTDTMDPNGMATVLQKEGIPVTPQNVEAFRNPLSAKDQQIYDTISPKIDAMQKAGVLPKNLADFPGTTFGQGKQAISGGKVVDGNVVGGSPVLTGANAFAQGDAAGGAGGNLGLPGGGAPAPTKEPDLTNPTIIPWGNGKEIHVKSEGDQTRWQAVQGGRVVGEGTGTDIENAKASASKVLSGDAPAAAPAETPAPTPSTTATPEGSPTAKAPETQIAPAEAKSAKVSPEVGDVLHAPNGTRYEVRAADADNIQFAHAGESQTITIPRQKIESMLSGNELAIEKGNPNATNQQQQAGSSVVEHQGASPGTPVPANGEEVRPTKGEQTSGGNRAPTGKGKSETQVESAGGSRSEPKKRAEPTDKPTEDVVVRSGSGNTRKMRFGDAGDTRVDFPDTEHHLEYMKGKEEGAPPESKEYYDRVVAAAKEGVANDKNRVKAPRFELPHTAEDAREAIVQAVANRKEAMDVNVREPYEGEKLNEAGIFAKGEDIVLHPEKFAKQMDKMRENHINAGAPPVAEQVAITTHEEVAHVGQHKLAIQEGFKGIDDKYTSKEYTESLPKDWYSKVQKARPTTFGKAFDDLDTHGKASAAAEFERMVLQGKVKGTITEAFFRHLKALVDYLKDVAKTGSEAFRNHVQRLEDTLNGLKVEKPQEPGAPGDSRTPETPGDTSAEVSVEKAKAGTAPKGKVAASFSELSLEDKRSKVFEGLEAESAPNRRTLQELQDDIKESSKKYKDLGDRLARHAKESKEALPQVAKEKETLAQRIEKLAKNIDRARKGQPLEAEPPAGQVPLPVERTPMFVEMVQEMAKKGINTPQGVVDFLKPVGPKAVKYTQGVWDMMSAFGHAESGPHDWPTLYAGNSEASKDSAPEPEPSEPKKVSPEQSLHENRQVTVKGPAGASFVRATDMRDRHAVEPIQNVGKGLNPFHQAGPFKKVQAGTKGRKGEFVPVPGEISVTPRDSSLHAEPAILEKEKYGISLPKGVGSSDARAIRKADTKVITSSPGRAPEDRLSDAIAHLRSREHWGRQDAGDAEQKSSGERQSQKDALVDWAKKTGAFADKLPRGFSWNSASNKGVSEHDVFFDKGSGRWIKYGKGFGLAPGVENGKWNLDHRATALQYLERLQAQNKEFGDDTIFHGMYADKNGNVAPIISQSDKGDERVTSQQIKSAMEDSGYLPIGGDAYYRIRDNVAVFDLHSYNVAQKDGKLLPFDSLVMHPGPQLLEAIKKELPEPLESEPATLHSVRAIGPDGQERRFAPAGEKPRILSTALMQPDGTALVGAKPTNQHFQGENSIMRQHMERTGEVPEGKSGFIVQDAGGNVRTTTNRKDAAAIIRRKGELHSQDLESEPANILPSIQRLADRTGFPAVKLSELAKELGVPETKMADFKKSMLDLRKQGRVNLTEADQSLASPEAKKWAIRTPTDQYGSATHVSLTSAPLDAEPIPKFRSAVERTAEEKLPNRGTPQQMLATLEKTPGVKREELQWLGVHQFLQGKPSVTKQELLDHIRANSVKLNEVVKGEGRPSTEKPTWVGYDQHGHSVERFDSQEEADKWHESNINELAEHWLDDMSVVEEDGKYIVRDSQRIESEPFDTEEEAEDHRQELAEELAKDNIQSGIREGAPRVTDEGEEDQTKFSQYKTPGGTDYKERLLTLPGKAAEWKSAEDLSSEWYQKPFHALSDSQRDDIEREIRVQTHNEATRKEFRSSHWDEPNPLAHTREQDFLDTEGKKLRLLEELQSDALQKLRKLQARVDAGEELTGQDKADYDLLKTFPFKKEWPLLAFKNSLAHAVAEGSDIVNATKPYSAGKLAENFFGRENGLPPHFTEMEAGVIAASHHDQVRRSIISQLPIDVVNDLGSQNISPEDIFRNFPVLLKSLPSTLKGPVISGIVNALGKTGALMRARLSNAFKTGGDPEILPTLRASDLNGRELLGAVFPQVLFHGSGSLGPEPFTAASAGTKSLSQLTPLHEERNSADLARFLDTRLPAFHGAVSPVDTGGSGGKSNPATFADFLKWHEGIVNAKSGSSNKISYAQLPIDKIGWTTAEPHTARWGTERIQWEKQDDGSFAVHAKAQHGGQAGDIALEDEAESRGLNPKNSAKINSREDLQRAIKPALTEGQDSAKLSDKLWKRMQTEPTGVSMPRKEGFEGHYDIIMPAMIGKYVKGMGGKVETSELPVVSKDSGHDGGRLGFEVQDPDGNPYDAFSTLEQARNAAEDAGPGYKVKSSGKNTVVHSITITPQMKKAVEENGQALFAEPVSTMLKPALDAIFASAKEIPHAIRAIIAPATMAKSEAVDALHRFKGEPDERLFRIGRVLRQAKNYFTRAGQQASIDFIDRFKTGQPQSTPELQKIADVIAEFDKQTWEQARQAYRDAGYKDGEIPLKWLENHFRVLWKIIPGTKEEKGNAGLHGKGPLSGSKGMQKQHTLPDISTGLAMGGVPYSYNPVELFERAQADLGKLIGALNMFTWLKKNGYVKFKSGKFPKLDEGHQWVDDPLFKVYFPAESGEGLIDAGKWEIEENVARMLKNYLSRDFVRESATGRVLMFAKNIITQAELALSPFHAVAMTLEAAGSTVGRGLYTVYNRGFLHADPSGIWEGLKAIVEGLIPGLSMTNATKQGSRALRLVTEKDYRNSPDGKSLLKQFPNLDYMVHLAFLGGMKLDSQDWKTNTSRTFLESVSGIWHGDLGATNFIKAGLLAFPSLNEVMMKPIFDHLIPNLKMGMFLRELNERIKQNDGVLTDEALARQTWRFVEDRFGEVNFDNLWWNRTFKAGMQLFFRSVSWKLGSVYALGGAIAGGGGDGGEGGSIGGQAGELFDAIKNRRAPVLHRKFAWLLGMCITTAAMAYVTQKLLTGKDPASLADLTDPQIDPSDPHLRVSTPTYVKDLVHFGHSPIKYLSSSLAGWIGKVADLWQNKDFYGTEIRHPGDALPTQAKDIAKYLGSGLMPFSVKGYRNLSDQQVSEARRVLALLGMSPAPKYVSQTPAEQLADYFREQHEEVGARTQSAAAHSREKAQAALALRQGREPSTIEGLTPQEIRTVERRAGMTPFQWEVSHLPAAEAQTVYAKATPAERVQLAPMMAKRAARYPTLTSFP